MKTIDTKTKIFTSIYEIETAILTLQEEIRDFEPLEDSDFDPCGILDDYFDGIVEIKETLKNYLSGSEVKEVCKCEDADESELAILAKSAKTSIGRGIAEYFLKQE